MILFSFLRKMNLEASFEEDTLHVLSFTRHLHVLSERRQTTLLPSGVDKAGDRWGLLLSSLALIVRIAYYNDT
jgi:hypothetical protein